MKPAAKTQPMAHPERANATGMVPSQSEALLQDLAEQKDLHLRLAADFENFKRRSRQEVDSRAAVQKEAFIAELLPVVDSLELALAWAPSRDSTQLHQGVEITLKQVQQLLRQHGVEAVGTIGEPFDPHRHEALAQGYDPAQPDHAVLAVLQRGYHRGEKVVRAAKVTVNDLSVLGEGRDGR